MPHSHSHAELLQPLLFQLFGLEEELKASLPLVVCEVEDIGPLEERRLPAKNKILYAQTNTFMPTNYDLLARIIQFFLTAYTLKSKVLYS